MTSGPFDYVKNRWDTRWRCGASLPERVQQQSCSFQLCMWDTKQSLRSTVLSSVCFSDSNSSLALILWSAGFFVPPSFELIFVLIRRPQSVLSSSKKSYHSELPLLPHFYKVHLLLGCRSVNRPALCRNQMFQVPFHSILKRQAVCWILNIQLVISM